MFNYIKTHGIKHTFKIIYQYKINMILERFLYIFLKNKPLKNIIMIESHNDFDCNGGAFYEYLINNGYNRKYKIVWFIKNEKPAQLPENVDTVPLYKPSIKRAYYVNMAKYFTADNTTVNKLRGEQVSVYLGHGAFSLKNTKGYMKISDTVNYLLTPSEHTKPILSEVFELGYPNNKQIVLGYPVHDTLYTPSNGEIKKITEKEYKKIILWMPTFRKGLFENRNDSTKQLPLGIPVISNYSELNALQTLLVEKDILLIIKIHPMQDLSTVKINQSENIKVIDGHTVKKLKVDNYRLMKDSDAIISDYSSVAYDYLHLNRPIAYTMDDVENYKLGLIVENPENFMAGSIIKSFDDMIYFIKDICEEKDLYISERKNIFDKIFKYHDGHSCERLAEYLQL